MDGTLQLESTVQNLERLIDAKEEFIDRTASMLVRYVDLLDITKPLIEAVGSEINATGRVSRDLIFGERKTRWTYGGKGKGLIHFVLEKATVSKNISTGMRESREAFMKELTSLRLALKEIESSEERMENIESRVGKLHRPEVKSVRKVGKYLERLGKVVEKMILRLDRQGVYYSAAERMFDKAAKYAAKQYVYVSRMRFLFTAHYYRRLARSYNKEQKYFRKAMKYLGKTMKSTYKEMVMFSDLIKKGLKLDRKLKRHRKDTEEDIERAKRLRGLFKKIRKLLKSIGKLDEVRAKYGERIVGNIKYIRKVSIDAVEDVSKEREEFREMKTLFDKVLELNSAVLRLSLNVLSVESSLKPHLVWINNSFVTMYKMARKKKSAEKIPEFASKVAEFAEKTLVPPLSEISERRKEVISDLTKEGNLFDELEKKAKAVSELNSKIRDSLDKMLDKMGKLQDNMDKGRKEAEDNLKKQIAELEKKAKKAERKLRRKARRAGVKVRRKEKKEIKDQIKRLKERLKELEEKYNAAEKDLRVPLDTIDKSIKGMPDFSFLIGSAFGKTGLHKITKGLTDPIDTMKGESKLEMGELIALREWISSPMSFDRYIEFLEHLSKVLDGERRAIRGIHDVEKEFSDLAGKFSNALDEMSKAEDNLAKGIQGLSEVLSKHPEVFAREGFGEVVSNMNELRTNISGIHRELMNIEDVLNTTAKGIDVNLRTYNSYLDSLIELYDMLIKMRALTEKHTKVIRGSILKSVNTI